MLNGFEGDKALINDPAKGAIKVPMATFNHAFTGVTLCFEPTDSFEKEGKPPSVVDFARSRMKGLGSAFVLVALTAAITAVIGIANTSFSRIFIDKVLKEGSGWLSALIVVMAAYVLQCVMTFINTVYLLRIQGKLAVVSTSRFMWHMLRLPIDFYSQRMVGDLQQRQDSNETIAYTLLSQLAPVLINLAFLILYLVMMISYSVPLTLIGLVGVAINVGLMRIISNKRVNVTRVSARGAGKLYATTVSGLNMIETFKSTGDEIGFFERWSGIQASVYDAQMRFERLNRNLGALPGIITTLTNIAILFTGAFLVMQGQFTVGMLLAFQGLLSNFFQPVTSIISLAQSLQEMRTSMERGSGCFGLPCRCQRLQRVSPRKKKSRAMPIATSRFHRSLEMFPRHVRVLAF